MAQTLIEGDFPALERPDEVRALLEQAMRGDQDPKDIQDLGDVVDPPASSPVLSAQHIRNPTDKPGQAKGEKTRSPFPVGGGSSPEKTLHLLPAPIPPVSTSKPESPSPPASVSLPTSLAASEAPEAESASGLTRRPADATSTREPTNEMEAFEMYVFEEVETRIKTALADTQTLAEDRYASLNATITRLQRRIEILEQRLTVSTLKPRSVEVSSRDPPTEIPGASTKPKTPLTAPSSESPDVGAAVRRLVGSHPHPPTMMVKKVYLSTLMTSVGHKGFKVTNPPTDSEWTEKGLLLWVDRQDV
jgi:hypothetical protein